MININGVQCEILGSINTGKREYVFILNGKDVEYYKRTAEGLVKPSTDYTLHGYAGKSLSELNENILISNMLKLMTTDYSKELIVKYINKIEQVIVRNPLIKPDALTASEITTHDENFMSHKKTIENFAVTANNDFLAENPKIMTLNSVESSKDFEIIEEDDNEIGKTMFGMAPVTNLDETMYHMPIGEIKEASDNVLKSEDSEKINDAIDEKLDEDKSFVLPMNDFYNSFKDSPTVETESQPDFDGNIEVPSFGTESSTSDTNEAVDLAAIVNQYEEDKKEVVEPEADELDNKAKVLKKTKKTKKDKRAAYIDTVILCLIAQLSIFGLLIIVLLVIK